MFFGTLISTHLIYRKLYPEEFNPTQLFSLELTSFLPSFFDEFVLDGSIGLSDAQRRNERAFVEM